MTDNRMAVSSCTSRNLSSLIFLIFAGLCLLPVSFSLPFVFLHGIGSSCNASSVLNFTEHLRLHSGTQAYCIEVGDGKGASWFMPIKKQIKIVCEQVKAIHTLRDGYNLVAYSQGNMVARGLIEFCDGAPKVNNYVSVAGPHAGLAYTPYCGSDALCEIAGRIIKGLGVYHDFVQEHLAPSGYIKIPNDTESYLRGSQFLPYVNNEIVDRRNATYKERFTSLNKLALVMFENDEVLIPRETSWFGFYSEENGSAESLPLPAKQTKLYTEDWIGLKTLDEAGKVEFFSVPGGHQSLNSSLLLNYVVDYLKAS